MVISFASFGGQMWSNIVKRSQKLPLANDAFSAIDAKQLTHEVQLTINDGEAI